MKVPSRFDAPLAFATLGFAPALALAFAFGQGCGRAPDAGAAPAASAASALASAAPAAAGPLGPLQRYALPASERVAFAATVLERLDAGAYGYLRVAREDGAQAWVVTMRPSVDAGARVRVTAYGRARDFDSKRLKRRFDELYFASVRPA